MSERDSILEPANLSSSRPSSDATPLMPHPVKRGSSYLIAIFSWLRDMLLSVLIAVLVILFLYRPVKVEGTSMMPGLLDQERLFINQFSYRFKLSDIHRGDTVVFWSPEDDHSKSYIKRVIGLPGDTVEVNHGDVIVNGKRLVENYVPPQYRDTRSYEARVVPRDEYFVLGDHRDLSNDSRSWGFVPRNYIYGKAVFVFWPPEHIGSIH